MERVINVMGGTDYMASSRLAKLLMRDEQDLLPKLPSFYPQKGHTYPRLREHRHLYLWLSDGVGKPALTLLPAVREPWPENPSRQVRRRLSRPAKVRPATRDRRWREAQGRRAS